MKPTLFVLAAGMGSRYGGLKQLDGLGPNGETIMDYSVFDAARAGFGKIVFVIRHTFEEDFRTKIASKYQGVLPVEIVFQETSYLPEGYTCPAERTKPWGTNHAVLMGKAKSVLFIGYNKTHLIILEFFVYNCMGADDNIVSTLFYIFKYFAFFSRR